VTFAEFVLAQLPRPPLRVLEVGCGREGGVVSTLVAAGYDVLAIDPQAPSGPRYRQIALEDFDGPGAFDAVVAGRVLHHVDPLAPALDKLARLAPLLIVDEFAWNHVDAATTGWYEQRHRELTAVGRSPKGPADLGEWRRRHADLHPYETLRSAIDARYVERHSEWRPYLYLWLEPEDERVEGDLVAAGVIRPIGFRYSGQRRSDTPVLV
jgi:SAM-dependent methyltransferase